MAIKGEWMPGMDVEWFYVELYPLLWLNIRDFINIILLFIFMNVFMQIIVIKIYKSIYFIKIKKYILI